MANGGNSSTARLLTAFKSGDTNAYRRSMRNVSLGINEAQRQYGQNLNSQFMDKKDTQNRFLTITDYKPSILYAGHIDPSL